MRSGRSRHIGQLPYAAIGCPTLLASALLSGDRVLIGLSAVVSSTDIERSREFYEHKVGLTLSPDTVPNHLLFEAGDGTTLLVYRRPSPNLAEHTQVRFWCRDVAADVSELVERKVEFDQVGFGDFKMVDHMLTTPVGSSAWFKDPDGNTIALVQPA